MRLACAVAHNQPMLCYGSSCNTMIRASKGSSAPQRYLLDHTEQNTKKSIKFRHKIRWIFSLRLFIMVISTEVALKRKLQTLQNSCRLPFAFYFQTYLDESFEFQNILKTLCTLCLKIKEKVSFNIASEASCEYILMVKQCYQTGQFKKSQ